MSLSIGVLRCETFATTRRKTPLFAVCVRWLLWIQQASFRISYSFAMPLLRGTIQSRIFMRLWKRWELEIIFSFWIRVDNFQLFSRTDSAWIQDTSWRRQLETILRSISTSTRRTTNTNVWNLRTIQFYEDTKNIKISKLSIH